MKTLIAILLLFLAVPLWAAPLVLVTPQGQHRYKLSELKAKLKVHVVNISDPVYGKSKAYDAFALADILNLAGVKPGEGADELMFTAKDGYSPTTPFETLRHYHAYLAFQEHGAAIGHFEDIRQGKAMLSPAPYYLVWTEGKAVADKVPWPYQLVRIELINFAQRYAKAFPKDAAAHSDERAGFGIFKNECMRCHSVYLEGGTVGPELNSPQNVTEYWRPDILPRFIHSASRFRYRSKMPDFPNLTSKQINQILAYLKYMKAHKVRN